MNELFDLSKFKFPELIKDDCLFHDKLSKLLDSLPKDSYYYCYRAEGSAIKFRGVTVHLEGSLFIGKNVKIKPGCIIEGRVFIDDDCTIGPFTYLRGDNYIGKNCVIGPCEIKNSLLLDNVSVHHKSYIGDSILGNYVNIAAGFTTANLRFDEASVKLYNKGLDFELINDSKRNKFGCVLGDYSKTMVNTYTMPGWVYPKNSVIAFDNRGIIQKV